MICEKGADVDSKELKSRTMRFAPRIVRLSAALPKTREADVIGRQLLRSGTSIGANYRQALRASSRRHFVSNVEICLREGGETVYWLELLADSEIVPTTRLVDLIDECNQFVAILTTTVRSAKENAKKDAPSL